MSATKKRYNSLDKKVAEERDVDDAIEAEMENGAAKRDEQEKIKSLLADTDKLIGNEEAHGDSTSDSEVKPLLTGADNSEDEELASFCAPKTLWGFTPSAWRSIFTFIMPLFHVLLLTDFLYGKHPVGNNPTCLRRNLNSSWPNFKFPSNGNVTANDDEINAEIQNQLGSDIHKLEEAYGKQTIFEEYCRFMLALGCLHLIIGAYDLIMCGKPNGDIFTILRDFILECFCGCTRYFICADDLSGKSDTVFGCDRRNTCCRTTCLCLSPVHRCISRLYSMIWYLPRWSIVLGAVLELICNGFFIFENPFIVGTSCFTLRIFSIAAIVINASLQGYKLRHRVDLGSVLLPDESAHIVRIEEADNILRPKVRGTGLFFCC